LKRFLSPCGLGDGEVLLEGSPVETLLGEELLDGALLGEALLDEGLLDGAILVELEP
jgi:hypothetical protein